MTPGSVVKIHNHEEISPATYLGRSCALEITLSVFELRGNLLDNGIRSAPALHRSGGDTVDEFESRISH